MSDSIFDDQSLKQQNQINYPQNEYSNVQQNSVATKLFNLVSSKISEFSDNQKFQKFQKEADKILKDNGDIFELFYMFGCQLTYKKDYIELNCPTIKMNGKITFDEKNEAVFDENVIKIFEHIIHILTSSNDLENTIDAMEAEGFYPIGELENQTIELNGEKKEILVGTLQNKNGETRNIYYLDGKEIFIKPCENQNQTDESKTEKKETK